MDQYDPDKRVGLIVDEWGTWHDPEPGTTEVLIPAKHPEGCAGSGINLNIFNNHCDRVQMANIAQTINVLQAVILTEGKNDINSHLPCFRYVQGSSKRPAAVC